MAIINERTPGISNENASPNNMDINANIPAAMYAEGAIETPMRPMKNIFLLR